MNVESRHGLMKEGGTNEEERVDKGMENVCVEEREGISNDGNTKGVKEASTMARVHETHVLKEIHNLVHEEVAPINVIMKENINPTMKPSGGKEWKRLARGGALTEDVDKGDQYGGKRKCNRPSTTWRSLLAGRTVLANGMRKSIGDGKATRVWEDPWVLFGRPSLLPAPIHNSTNVEKVCDLMHESGDCWDEGRLRECFDEDICQRILCVPPNKAQGPDRWVWEMERSGTYSVKSGYRCALMDTWSQFNMGLDIDTKAISKFWKRLWKLPMLSRYKVFLWRVCWGIIPTVETLERRGIEINEVCPMCNYESESIYHALIDCPEIQIMNAKKFSNEVIKAEKLWSKVERIMDEYQAANLTDLNNIVVPSKLEWEKPEYPT
ncbi:reverse transcriptase [Senna tora]|uniref:Reverse transcriptase n=1 Tax=Senna tora TaxID=362788 RepID=A0A834X6W0_9FABA|nr:reverse transcriptase [Senna tora]